jgi:hypothetical protein
MAVRHDGRPTSNRRRFWTTTSRAVSIAMLVSSHLWLVTNLVWIIASSCARTASPPSAHK